ALVGTGSIARAHAHALRLLQHGCLPPLECHVILGSTEAKARTFADEFGFAHVGSDLASVLADEQVNAVILCSPSALHAAQAEQALRAGKHVLCEIPLALSLAETDRLIEIQETAKCCLMVGHTLRYQPALLKLRQQIAAGELHPHAAVCRWMFERRENILPTGQPRTWTDNLLWHHGCHAVDGMLWLLGADQAAVSSQVALPGQDLGIPMDITLTVRTARDQLATAVLSYNSRVPLVDFVVIGEESTQIVDGGEFRTQFHIVEDGLSHPIAQQDAEFFTAIREGREPAVSARGVRPAMAALQSAQKNYDDLLQRRGLTVRHPRFP
ncbi:MAG: Gfo/Idh/MocA family oxidoreductase, partial [Chloroflexota bacterium]|nr:Gfo/Idh/MocA family oxidoreductase [Chloroflexota bacterium]